MIQAAHKDSVIRHGLSSRVKYVRIVRREVHDRIRHYAQLVFKGLSTS